MSEPRGPRLDDEVLKAAYQRAHAMPRGAHLSETQWEQLTCGELADTDRDRLLDHVFSCPACREVHRSLLQVSAEAPGIDQGAVPAAPTRPVARAWMYLGALATAAALVAAVLVDLRPLRGARDATVTRNQAAAVAITVVTPAEGAPLEQRRFAWLPLPGAEAYELIVSNDDGGAVWSGRATEALAQLPPEVVLAPGRYYWRVTALRDNAVVGSSRLLPFRVN